MSDVLIRGIPRETHKELERIAEAERLSVNQLLVRLITESVRHRQSEREKERRRLAAFERLREIHEKIRQQYGPSEDSTKIIREWRDTRNQ